MTSPAPTAASNAKAGSALATAAAGAVVAKTTPTLRELVASQESEIAKALPNLLDAGRYVRIVQTELRKNPKLGNCSPSSFLGAVLTAAQLGLEFGPTQQAYLIPYRNHGTDEVQLIIGYKGWLSLINRSSEIQSVSTRTVHARDHFRYEFGLDEVLEHRPAEGDRGPITHYYCIIRKTNGGRSFEVCTVEEIEKHRDRYAKKGGEIRGPWKDDFDAMAKKTVFLKAKTWLPMSAESTIAQTVDNGVINRTSAEQEPEVAQFDDDDVVEAEIVGGDTAYDRGE